MIGQLLLPPAVGVDTFGDPAEAELFTTEQQFVADAVDARRREFTSVRLCARRALSRLGLGPVPILPGPRGEPRWPDGIVGSMTHCTGYRAAALARAAEVLALGIDAEPNAPLPPGILAAVALADEQQTVAALGAARPEVHWDRLLFSAKESVFKVWYPLARRQLEFDEARIAVHPDGTFDVRLLVPGPLVGDRRLSSFTGRWLVRAGLLVTAITLPSAPSQADNGSSP